MADHKEMAVNPFIQSQSLILRGMSGVLNRQSSAAPEPISPTPSSAAVLSTTAPKETASASLGRGHGSSPPCKEQIQAPRSSQEPKPPRRESERQQDSSREESNMEGPLLVDIRDDYIEVDEDCMEVSSDARNRPDRGLLRHFGKLHSTRHSREKHVSSGTRGVQRPQGRLATDLTILYKEQSAKLLEADGTIIEKDKQINALTETISRLHQRDGGVSRDDDYLTAQFSDITNSITAWTVAHFRKSQWQKITDFRELPQDLAQMVGEVVYDSTNILESIKSRRDLVNAMVIHTLFIYLFRPFLFGAPEAGEHLLAVWSQLHGTDYQVQRWRALTVNLLAQGPTYEHRYNQEISSIAATLANLLAYLAPMESDAEARNAELHKIVGRAAALSVEIHKQSDLIYLLPIQPGRPFTSDLMEDLNFDYELHELEGKARVQVPIFPAIMRRSCTPGGMLGEPYNLMKARVTTMFVDNE